MARAELELRVLRSERALDDLAPQLVASASAGDWVAIATEECTPLGAARQIDHQTWLAAATRLATLHSCVLDPHGVPRAQQPALITGDAALLGPWFTLGAVDDAVRGTQRLADQPPSPLPEVLAHGDSHLGNILRDPTGALVWIDWQETHVGDGLDDLVFLWQRAEFDGAHPPRAEMTLRYAQTRELELDRLQPLIDQVELRLLLHSWPPFLGYGSSTARETMRRRLAALAHA